MNEQEREEEMLSDLSHILGTTQGRRYLWRKLEELRIYKLSCLEVQDGMDIFLDDRQTVFNDGLRAAGLKLHAEIISVMPDYYAIMAKEIYDN